MTGRWEYRWIAVLSHDDVKMSHATDGWDREGERGWEMCGVVEGPLCVREGALLITVWKRQI